MEIASIAVVLKQNELLFADMYRECVRLFPDYAREFEALALEEEGHAAIIDSVIEEISEHPENWRQGKVTLQTLRFIQNQIKATLKEIRQGQCDPHYAITALRSYEQSMCERSVEKALESDVAEFKHLLSLVAEGFATHLRCLQELEHKIFKTSDVFDSLDELNGKTHKTEEHK
ncbi:MAG TPA: hypothetical protein DCG57_13910 [Candidatus Riflebacteria bacterium]|jgi:rubrerythrin|nr:hypothetical protein [Candidatus Riflebacteria bacterium]